VIFPGKERPESVSDQKQEIPVFWVFTGKVQYLFALPKKRIFCRMTSCMATSGFFRSTAGHAFVTAF
jgi:hypothetical protein